MSLSRAHAVVEYRGRCSHSELSNNECGGPNFVSKFSGFSPEKNKANDEGHVAGVAHQHADGNVVVGDLAGRYIVVCGGKEKCHGSQMGNSWQTATQRHTK